MFADDPAFCTVVNVPPTYTVPFITIIAFTRPSMMLGVNPEGSSLTIDGWPMLTAPAGAEASAAVVARIDGDGEQATAGADSCASSVTPFGRWYVGATP